MATPKKSNMSNSKRITAPSPPLSPKRVELNNKSDAEQPEDEFQDVKRLFRAEFMKRSINAQCAKLKEFEEKMEKYKTLRKEYEDLFSTYVSLVHMSERRAMLKELCETNDVNKIKDIKANITELLEKLNTESAVCVIDETTLAQCKKNLHAYNSNDRLQSAKVELTNQKKSVATIRTTLEALPLDIQSTVVQAIDQTSDILHVPDEV